MLAAQIASPQLLARHFEIGIFGSRRSVSVIVPSKVWTKYFDVIRLAISIPLTLFPCLSKRGEKIHIPISLGTINITPPPTPLFAGNPTCWKNVPLALYIPLVCRTGKQFLTVFWLSTRSWVRGLTPLLASVAAAVAKFTEVISNEHILK